jgi:hypothetical protein
VGTLSLDEFKTAMVERAKFFRDEMIFADEFRMDPNDGAILRAKKDLGVIVKYEMTKHGFATLCQKLGIPTLYALRCPPDLRATNFNFWLEKKKGKELFCRFDSHPDGQEKIRAVLSTRYADLPNTELAKMLIDKANPGYDFGVTYIMHEAILLADLVASNKDFVSEDFSGAIHVRNSEVGLAKLSFQSMLYNRVDQSGIILHDYVGFDEKHIGDKTEFAKAFGESIDKIMANIAGAIRNLNDLKTVAIHDVPDIIDVICNVNRVKDSQKAALDRAQGTFPVDNLFDVVCLFVRAATDGELTMEDREELQTVGGDIVMKAKRYQRWV